MSNVPARPPPWLGHPGLAVTASPPNPLPQTPPPTLCVCVCVCVCVFVLRVEKDLGRLVVCRWSLTRWVFPVRRHGKEGRPQADAGVVQTGAGEERPGPLRVGAHDIVSTDVVPWGCDFEMPF